MQSTSRSAVKRTVKLKYVITICGAICLVVWTGLVVTASWSSQSSSRTTEESLKSLEIKEKTDSIHAMVGELHKDAKDSKATLSTLGSNMEDLQSQLSTLSSLVDSAMNSLPDQAATANSKSSNSESETITTKKSHKELIQSVVKTVGGEGWKMVSFDNDELNQHDFDCELVNFVTSGDIQTGHKICIHRFDDVISNVIRTNGNWMDCNVLSQFWKSEVGDNAVDPVYVEIGANIGSCIMEMLFSTDATIVAFEPNPKNLYPLKKTMSMLPKSYQERVALFPIALGSTTSSSTIYSASNNMGNSHVGTPVKDLDMGTQDFHEKDTFDIKVERLDSILKTGSKIALMKLDAQGFECEILDGMGHDLASTVNHVHFEKSDRFLNAHGCYNILAKFRNLGFTIYNDNNVIGPEKDNMNLAYDLEARKSHP